MIQYLSLGFSIACMLMIFGLYYLDRKKYSKKTHYHPNLSIIIPFYNKGDSIEATVQSVFESYDNQKLDLIIINDRSNIQDTEIIKGLSSKYDFTFLENDTNLGKSKTLNQSVQYAKNDIVLFLDADMIINPKNIQSMLDRLSDGKISATSCPYRPIQTGFRWNMQKYEYIMMSYLQIAYNRFSCISLRGWCIMIQKSVFVEVGWFSEYAYTEDMELAMKLGQAWYKVHQTDEFAHTFVPTTFRKWTKQKIRRNTWWFQCMLRYPKVWLSRPLHMVFTTSFILFNFIFALGIWNAYVFGELIADRFNLISVTYWILESIKILWFVYIPVLLTNFWYRALFSLLSLPYIIRGIHKRSDAYKILRVIPFSIIYMPLFGFVWLIGMFNWFIHYRDKKNNKRWR